METAVGAASEDAFLKADHPHHGTHRLMRHPEVSCHGPQPLSLSSVGHLANAPWDDRSLGRCGLATNARSSP
jgi:hypothetical protein